MGRNPRANEAARAEAQRRLRVAALELLAERGVAGTSMAALAERAGVSKGLAYHYFPNKRALVEAMVQDRIAEVQGFGAAVLDDLPPGERLRRFAHAIAAATESDPQRFRLFLRALLDPELRDIAGGLAPADRDGLIAVFRELGVADPALEASFFQIGLLGIVTQAATSPRPTPAAELVDRLVRAIVPEDS